MNQKDKSNWEKVKVKMNVSVGNKEQNTNEGKVKIEKDKDEKTEKIEITTEKCKKLNFKSPYIGFKHILSI